MVDLLGHLVLEHVIDEIDHAPRTGRDDDVGLGCLDAFHLLVGDLLRQVVVIDAEGTSHTAAHVRIGHLHVVQAFEGFQDGPGLVLDVLVPDKVAGVMPGGGLAFKLFLQLEASGESFRTSITNSVESLIFFPKASYRSFCSSVSGRYFW